MLLITTPPEPESVAREVELIEEHHIVDLRVSMPPYVIPFSNIIIDQDGVRLASPPITLGDIDPFGLSEFEPGKATARHIDQSRVNHQTDDRLVRIDFGAPDINPDLLSPEVPPNAIAVIASPPPVTLKPGPPPPPFGRPSRFPMDLPIVERPRPFLVPPDADDTDISCQCLDFAFFGNRAIVAFAIARRVQFCVSVYSGSLRASAFTTHASSEVIACVRFTHRMMGPPILTRPGTSGPSIPSGDPMSAAYLPPTSIRTTREGVRLEITTASTLALARPEIVTPSAISPSNSPSGGPVPELGPDI